MKKWILGFLVSLVTAFMVYSITAATAYTERLSELEKETIELTTKAESIRHMAEDLEKTQLSLRAIETNLAQIEESIDTLESVKIEVVNLIPIQGALRRLERRINAIDHGATMGFRINAGSSTNYEFYRDRYLR